MQLPTPSAELGRIAPLTAGALYLNFISTYGAALVTTIAITYGIMQMIFRWREHKKIMAAAAPVAALVEANNVGE